MILRPYQLEALDKIHEHYTDSSHGLCQAATGTGKTVIIKHLELPGPYLILAHRHELIDQLRLARPDATIETIQKLSRSDSWIKESLPLYKTVIIDEAHHSAAITYQKIILALRDNQNLLGFTATPFRFDEKDLSFAYGYEPIFQYPLLQAIKEGYLCDIKGVRIQTSYDWQEVFSTSTEPSANNIGIQYNKHEDLIKGVKEAIEICEKPAIVFMPTIESAEMLNLPIISTHTNPDIRKRIVSDFRASKFETLANVEILTEGVDLPDVRSVILGRPTKSPVLFSQMCGRGSRLSPGAYHIDQSEKKYCTIYEFRSSGDMRGKLFNDFWDLSGYIPDEKTKAKTDTILDMIDKLKIDTKKVIIDSIKNFDFFKINSRLPKADWIPMINGCLMIFISPPAKTSELYIITKPNPMGYSRVVVKRLGKYSILRKDTLKRCLQYCDKHFEKNFANWLWKQSTRKCWKHQPATNNQKQLLGSQGIAPSNKLQAVRLTQLFISGMFNRVAEDIKVTLCK